MDFLKYHMHEILQLQTKEEMETASELATMGSCGGRLAALFPPPAAEISAQHIKIVYIYTLLIFVQNQYGDKNFYTLYYTL
jgi:hypothetical protein